MSEFPWVRFYPSDWLAGTRGMKASESGVYITLIMMMYERQEPLKLDVGRLARVCGASNAAFKRSLDALVEDGKIERLDDLLWNSRVDREVKNRSEKSEIARQSANQRWTGSGEKTQQKQRPKNANAEEAQCEPNANQKSEVRDQITTTTTARPDYDDLATRLFEAGGAALNQTTTQLTQLNTPLSWLNEGCDLELDIVQTIRRLCEKKPPNSVSTWRYFTPAIAQAKADRETPLPEVSPNVKPLRPGSHESHLAGAFQAAQEFERPESTRDAS